MLKYDECNKAVKGCIDYLVDKYVGDMKEFPLSWVECAYNRAMMIRLVEIEKKDGEVNEPE